MQLAGEKYGAVSLVIAAWAGNFGAEETTMIRQLIVQTKRNNLLLIEFFIACFSWKDLVCTARNKAKYINQVGAQHIIHL
jgi:hypothetical protein